MPVKQLRFAMDEKGLKTLAPTLAGKEISYWDDDRRLVRGRVKSAEVARDRYGNPFIAVDIEPETAAEGSEQSPAVPATEPAEA